MDDVDRLRASNLEVPRLRRECEELRAAAKRYQLRLAPNLDAESILLELCVTMLQRMMRLRYTLFKTFGNLLFARAVDASTGLPRAADYGTIAWKKETEDSPYLVCSDTTSPKLLANFLRYGPWKIARPNLLITIFGSARDFKLEPPKLARLFSKGFAEAVTTAKAVVTTAGTDAGVAKLVADALAPTNPARACLPSPDDLADLVLAALPGFERAETSYAPGGGAARRSVLVSFARSHLSS